MSSNRSASLLNLGDGIFACEFHSKMNALDEGTLAILNSSLDRLECEGKGLVIANEGEHFSVGADLGLILGAAENGRWEELDRLVRALQGLCMRIRFSKKPVVAVPFGRTLGGACEICLAAAARVAHIESYMGLVELSVGLVPGGGGCKNMLLAFEQQGGGPMPKVAAAFEQIALSRVSTSAREAEKQGFLTCRDLIVFDRDALLSEARATLLDIAPSYSPPMLRTDISMPGKGGAMALVDATRGYVQRGIATEYDAFIADKLAHVLAGGDQPSLHTTTEEHLLDLERETFLSLAGDPRTRARIEHMLKTGKPLRN